MTFRLKSIIVLILSLSIALVPAAVSAHYAPRPFDYFGYTETIDLGNGRGNYDGYTEHQDITGQEVMMDANNGIITANYSYSWAFSNSSGSSESGSSAGSFTFSSENFLYLVGTDDQVGLYNPSVWFFMDNDLPVGGTFFFLDTPMTVMDRNYSYYLPSQDEYVSTIFAQGSSSYNRNDVYGQFTATYTYSAYYDPNTGYIVGYNYEEQDSDPSGNGFTWTENLYISSGSYSLTIAPNPNTTDYTGLIFISLVAFIFVVFFIVFGVVAYRNYKKNKLPEHSMQQAPPPPLNIDLTPKEQPPVQQIVIKEVAKVKCKYCGALIDSTAQVCPICGGPNS